MVRNRNTPSSPRPGEPRIENMAPTTLNDDKCRTSDE